MVKKIKKKNLIDNITFKKKKIPNQVIMYVKLPEHRKLN